MILNASSRNVTTIRKRPIAGRYGLRGSDSVSKKSSILLVCLRIASSGDGSFVADELDWPPNEGD
jgi:hypothetical protein